MWGCTPVWVLATGTAQAPCAVGEAGDWWRATAMRQAAFRSRAPWRALRPVRGAGAEARGVGTQMRVLSVVYIMTGKGAQRGEGWAGQ